ncbi:DNA-binding transcriptional repressor DeoR [Acerihabitans arboris]|uniref:DNA-binding transcriptional repressor DeoR n=1 Tax=Acerihabitans arboris TaxID=2691583 RepID=A0A845SQ52_9GAMM|nr:DNA-binding transcriptional repressor DeoR [Acerihabitans arboris]NDL64721.1 DNA-binding transcriptional repressor DeoR [Acerihabitans arboris]
METRREERIHKLILALKREDKMHLKDAALLLGVSEMTIRRDLSAEPAQVVLLGGYVVNDPRNHNVTHYFVSDQKAKHVEEKSIAGRLAAALIEPDDTVFFDCGTTTSFIIDAIGDDLPFTAICYSLNTFLALQDRSNCKVILCGGEFHPANCIFTPLTQHSILDNIRPDKAFISAAGIDIRFGATCFNFDELTMKHRALSRSQQAIVVADHSKFDNTKAAFIGALSLFNILITDQSPHRKFHDYCRQHKITLRYPRE